MRPSLNRFVWVFLTSIVATVYNFGANAAILSESGLACVALIGLRLSLVWWVRGDSLSTRYWPAFHYGLWVFVAAPIVVPHYLLRTRGRAGLPLVLLVLAVMLAPTIASWIGWLAYPHIPESLWIEGP